MSDPSDPRPIAGSVIAELSDFDLELADASIRAQAMTICNHSLLEALKAGTCFQVASACSMLTAGLLIGPYIPYFPVLVIGAALLATAGTGIYRGNQHRNAAKGMIDDGRAVEDFRDRVRAELQRRGRA